MGRFPVAALIVRAAQMLPSRLVRFLGRSQFRFPLAGPVLRSLSAPILHSDATIRHGAGAGLRFNPSGTNAGYALGTTEPRIQETLAQCVRSGTILYDIGANVGFFTVIAANLTRTAGHVFAFEPLPANADAIEHNVGLNGFTNVTVVRVALTDRVGKASLNIGALTGQSRLAGLPVGENFVGDIEVETTTVDHLIEGDAGLPAPDVVKIDVEGAEIQVLAGMQHTLEYGRPIVICELHGTNKKFAELMNGFDYRLEVLEGYPRVEAAPWWVHVIATPAENPAPSAGAA